MPKGFILAGEAYLGEINYTADTRDIWWWTSSAYFCPVCGEIWARIVMETREGKQQPFSPKIVSCPQHPDPWNVPGSLLTGFMVDKFDALPPDAIKREFEIHMAQAEKG